MFGRRKRIAELDPPPIAGADPRAVEVLMVWAAPGASQQLALRTCWNDPGAWGVLLVDVARHVANAYRSNGQDPQDALRRIRQAFDAEWSSRTSAAEDLTGEV